MRCAAVLLFAAAAPAAAAPTKVLPLGDSITYGCGDECGPLNCMNTGDPVCPDCAGGYRTPLWRQLSASAPGAWEFVGSQENGPADIDRHHEGHPGWSCEQIQGINASWAPTQPDVVLLHLGTNNMGIDTQTAAVALTHMQDLIGTIFSLIPKTRVLLATLIGASKIYGGNKHAEYNAGLAQLVKDKSAAGLAIDLVDMEQESGIGANCDAEVNGTKVCCPLHIHPNDAGYKLMANVWFKHLSALR